MFTWLATLPIIVQVGLIIGVFIVAVVLAFIGKVNLKLGKYTISFGKSFRSNLIKKERSCEDCRKLVMIRTMKFDQDVKLVKDDILRDQMNYAEQKVHEVSYMLTTSYREDIINLRKSEASIDTVRENKEYLLYQETLTCALAQIKNQIRHAFKENGFVEFSPQEFSDYVKGKSKLLVNIGKEYVRSRYPFENMIVPIDKRFETLPEIQIEACAFDLFTKAKQIKLLADEKIEELGREYDKDMEEFCSLPSKK